MVRILLVDDDTDLLFLISEYLGLRGIECETAESASQARDLLKRSAFDIVISDFNMPCESGLDLFRSISSIYPGIQFIIMSGSIDQKLKRQAIDMGVADFVEKPFVFRDLVDTVIHIAKSKVRPVTRVSSVHVLPVRPRIATLSVSRSESEKRLGCATL